MRKWWVSYENIVYPLLVLLENPFYFFAVIGVSQLYYLYTSIVARKDRKWKIVKAMYPIVFHVCFIIFKVSGDKTSIAVSSVVCLVVFVVGSVHYLS